MKNKSDRLVRVGARGSKLALIQAECVLSLLRQKAPEYAYELAVIKTAGDRDHQAALPQMGGQGVFVKEIEAALLHGEIDLAVHSAKDLPAKLAEGLVIAAVPERGSVADVLITTSGVTLAQLPQRAKIATGSPRRRALVSRLRSDLQFVDVRGNVNTRLRKLQTGDFDALILAKAGLERLGLMSWIAQEFPPEDFLPAPGQGALAVEGRVGDDLLEVAASLNSELDHACLIAERALLRKLHAGCSIPLGAWARPVAGKLQLGAILCEHGAQRVIQAQGIVDTLEQAEKLGKMVAEKLIRKGAAEILYHES